MYTPVLTSVASATAKPSMAARPLIASVVAEKILKSWTVTGGVTGAATAGSGVLEVSAAGGVETGSEPGTLGACKTRTEHSIHGTKYNVRLLISWRHVSVW